MQNFECILCYDILLFYPKISNSNESLTEKNVLLKGRELTWINKSYQCGKHCFVQNEGNKTLNME